MGPGICRELSAQHSVSGQGHCYVGYYPETSTLTSKCTDSQNLTSGHQESHVEKLSARWLLSYRGRVLVLTTDMAVPSTNGRP